MNKEEIAKQLEKMVDRTEFDLSAVPYSILESACRYLNREMDKRKDEPRVLLLTVGESHCIDKFFREEDRELAEKYAKKSLEAMMSDRKYLSLEINCERVKESDVANCLAIKGKYE